MSYDQMVELSQITGIEVGDLENMDEDELWDLWDEATNDYIPPYYLG